MSGDRPKGTQMSMAEHAVDRTVAGEVDLEADAVSDELMLGTLVGEYEVVRKVGEGGMGAVYEAVHPVIGRKVAIKVLSAEGGALQGASARFLQEARTASRVRHRNIVDVFAFGELVDGRSYLVMDFLEGEPLTEYLERRGPLSYREAMSIIDGVVAGLAAAHVRGVVHRDLKPDNIWILPPDDGLDGTVAPPTPGVDASAPASEDVVDPLRIRLLDFGIAKVTSGEGANLGLTRAGSVLGTPAFMSPEQCRGDGDIDARADVYALGVILYQMFAGRVPFRADTYVEVLTQHLAAPPPPLDGLGVPPELEEVIQTALAKDRAARWQSVVELRSALAACETARDYSPARVILQASDEPAHPTVAGAKAAGGDETGGVRPFETGALRVAPLLDRETLYLAFLGELEDGLGVRGLALWLGDLIEQSGDEIARIVIEIAGLEFLGTDGIACLGSWLGFLKEARADGLAPTTVRYSDEVRWQRNAVRDFQRIDPALRVEAVAGH